MSYQPFVSVIIPVYNDLNSLERCLSALEAQSYPLGSYEVIVIDNASEEDVKTITAKFSRVYSEYEPKRSSYAARNKGIEVARGELIAFTDSDCIPHPNWIEALVKQFIDHDRNCGLVAGRIQSTVSPDGKSNPVELFDSLYAFPQKKYVEQYKFGVTANLMTSIQVINHVGLFNSDLRSGGDYEWGWRVHRAGYRLVYAENAVVAHPARSTLKALITKSTRVVEGHYELKKLGIYSPVKFFLASVVDFLIPFRSVPQILMNQHIHSLSNKAFIAWISTMVNHAKARKRLQLQIGIVLNK